MVPEESWVEAFESSAVAAPRVRPQLSTPEKLVVWGCWVGVACMLLFLPIASVAGLGAVSLVLLPFYALPVLLGLSAWAAWRRKGRLPGVVWFALGTFLTVGTGFAALLNQI